MSCREWQWRHHLSHEVPRPFQKVRLGMRAKLSVWYSACLRYTNSHVLFTAPQKPSLVIPILERRKLEKQSSRVLSYLSSSRPTWVTKEKVINQSQHLCIGHCVTDGCSLNPHLLRDIGTPSSLFHRLQKEGSGSERCWFRSGLQLLFLCVCVQMRVCVHMHVQVPA